VYFSVEIQMKRLTTQSACNTLSNNLNDKVSSNFNIKQCDKIIHLFVHNFASTVEITNYETIYGTGFITVQDPRFSRRCL
jgi:hypothetical protein